MGIILAKKIYYSTISDNKAENITPNSESEKTIICYNGLWKLYSTIFISSGDKYQTFTLSNLKSDSD